MIVLGRSYGVQQALLTLCSVVTLQYCDFKGERLRNDERSSRRHGAQMDLTPSSRNDTITQLR